jgi:hypothetical protein
LKKYVDPHQPFIGLDEHRVRTIVELVHGLAVFVKRSWEENESIPNPPSRQTHLSSADNVFEGQIPQSNKIFAVSISQTVL